MNGAEFMCIYWCVFSGYCFGGAKTAMFNGYAQNVMFLMFFGFIGLLMGYINIIDIRKESIEKWKEKIREEMAS